MPPRRRPRPRPTSRRSRHGRCPRARSPSPTVLLRQTRTRRPHHRLARTDERRLKENRHLRLILITLLALIVATVVGLGATWMTATRGTDLGTLTIGAWTARPRTGSSEIDPYARASIARSGELPVGTGDGV